ncbi:MAG: permease [Flavobacterium johnsoniae]|nr:MAG: permease [Flavobacterium johnsoniae]
MKILDRYILTTFLKTLATVFVILFFIFILQAVWLFIAELAGKDLDVLLIVKFLLFYSPKMIPLVLPLSILLASIMTFGNLAENYEFAAMKSSGISLQRAMKSLMVFIVFLSIIAFFFANNIIPSAEYKFLNLRRDIVQTKPAMAIAEGQFSDVGDYNIKVNKKSGDKGEKLSGVTIHKKAANGIGNNIVIKAKNGLLVNQEESTMLQMILFDGNYYENIIPKKYEERNRVPFVKASFKKDIINIDLSKLNTVEDESNITNTNAMLNVSELTYTLDSLHKNFNKDLVSFAENIYQRSGIINFRDPNAAAISKPKKDSNITDPLSILSTADKSRALEIAISNLESAKFSIEGTKQEMELKQKNINNHWLALYEKFVIAFSCILMFFIGAPLGAIIRKGGLGLPIVFAVLIFITFHFINTFGRKLAQENGIPPFLGSWMSSFILSPLAVLLTYRATNDIGLINMDIILSPIQKGFQKLFRIKNNNTPK